MEENKVKNIKIIICKGMQASGKSSWAIQFIKDNQNFKRVNRDSLRHMLSGYTFDKENERIVTIIEDAIIEELLSKGYNLVLDNMHLSKDKLERQKRWLRGYCENVIKKEVEFEIKNFPVTLEEALNRDKLRDFPMGTKVLKRTWYQHKDELVEMLKESKPKVEYDPALPNCIICDVDGTLAEKGDRNPYDLTKVKEDTIIKPIKDLVLMFIDDMEGKRIPEILFIFSGRDDSCYEDTEEWLEENNIPFYDLVMRKTGDSRKDSIVKKEMYEAHIKGKYNVLYVIDDRKQVIDMWRNELGLTVLDVAGNNF